MDFKLTIVLIITCYSMLSVATPIFASLFSAHKYKGGGYHDGGIHGDGYHGGGAWYPYGYTPYGYGWYDEGGSGWYHVGDGGYRCRSYNDIYKVITGDPYANPHKTPFPAQPFWTFAG